MTYSINILDNKNKKIGELLTASGSDILNLLHKGFIIIDIMTGMQITESDIMSTIGVSDSVIDIG